MTGVVTLSVEIELGWGYHDLQRYDRLSTDGKRELTALDRLLDRCDQLDVPFTFDVVGRLFDDERSSDDAPHPDGWFDTVPDDPGMLFYSPEMVGGIQRADVDHEICTHTYSHTICDDVSPDVVAWDLQRAAEVHREVGEPAPVSLVPPRHFTPDRSVLRDAGIEIVRTVGYDPAPTKLHKLNRLLFDPLPPKPPRLVDGVVETYCAPFTTLTASSLPAGAKDELAMFRPVPRAVRQRLHERYLRRSVEKAAEQNSYTHLWCHLHDLANDDQWKPIHSFLGTLADMRDRGEVEVLPMVALNEHVRGRAGDDRERERTRSPVDAPVGGVQ